MLAAKTRKPTRKLAGFRALLLMAFAGSSLYLSAGPAPRSRSTQTASSEAANEIRAVLTTQQQAWNRGDIPAFLEGYWNSPELTFAGSDGIVRGYDGLLERYRRSYPDKAHMGG